MKTVSLYAALWLTTLAASVIGAEPAAAPAATTSVPPASETRGLIDADGEYTLQAFTPGVFYRVRIEADIPAGVFDVYVDNEAKASEVPFIAKAATLDNLTFQSWGSTAGTNYVDDVVVSRDIRERDN